MTRCARTLHHQYIPPIAAPEQGSYDAIVMAVGHDELGRACVPSASRMETWCSMSST